MDMHKQVDPAWDRIRATVFLGLVPWESEGHHKVRAVIWSGPDYRTPTIHQGAIYESYDEARQVFDLVVDALERLNIPVELEGDARRDDAAGPLLPTLREGDKYSVRGGVDG